MSDKNNELVSIYITTKNRVELLSKALNSVINQSYNNIEIIVVNDGSEDETQEYLNTVKKFESRLLIINNKTSIGACAARNLAIQKATGIYITGLDDDDQFDVDRVAILKDAYDENVSFVCDNAYCYHNNKRKNEKKIFGDFDLVRLLDGNICNQIFTETYKIREIGGFDESLTSCQDYDLWVRLVMQFGIARKLPTYTYIYDISHGKERVSSSNRAKDGAIRFFNKHRSLMNKHNLANQYIRLLNYGVCLTLNQVIYSFLYGAKLKLAKVYFRKKYIDFVGFSR